MAYIIDYYDKYNKWDRDHSVYVFTINDTQYAIKEVILFWGLPQLPFEIYENKNPESYLVYGTIEDAKQYVRQLKSLNR